MDRNDLLTTTRVEFLRLFSHAMSDLIPRSMDQLFNKADNFGSSTDQDLFLDARNVLLNRSTELRQKMIKGMEQLIDRSFQTAYSSFRPSFSSAYRSQQFSLVDSSIVEDELRIDAMTKRFRNEAEEQLRDLNIRVALLLEQDNIKERENPSRPYLFSRCIASATENLGIPPALNAVLSDQLAIDLANNIADIYDGINAHLAQHGIAAQLQLKIRKSPSRPTVAPGVLTNEAPQAVKGGRQPDASSRMSQHRDQRVASTAMQESKTDRLFEMIMSIAGNPAGNTTPTNPRPQAARQAMPADAGVVSTKWSSGTQVVGKALRAFFSEQSVAAASTGESSTFARPCVPSRLTRSVHDLQRENTPGGDEMLDTDGTVRNLIAEQRTSLNGKTHNIGEQMIIDIVALLFEFILRDKQVPAEVRAQLGRLQFLVLKVALLEPELLTKKNHPARVLINRIGSISIGFQQADPATARIIAEISRIVEALLADAMESPQLFSKILDELDAFIARELRIGDAQIERAAQAVEKAEDHALRFTRTTANIGAALDGLSIAPFLSDFFLTTWARAIERAGRSDGRREKRFKQLIADLLWSIVPKVTEQDRAQLVALLPTMLPELRDGLKLADIKPEHQQDILNWLIDAHTQAMRCSGIASNVPSLSETRKHFEPFFAQTEEDWPPRRDTEPHASDDGDFIHEAARELGIELQVIDTPFDLKSGSEQPSQRAAGAAPALAADTQGREPTEEDAAHTARLRSGVMVQLHLDGAWVPGRLSWVSSNTLHLLLDIGQRNTLSVISLPIFRRLLANGHARFQETAPLFERAVQSLLQAADQIGDNSN